MRVFLALIPVLLSGCWNFVLDVCPDCRIVEHRRAVAPPLPASARVVVVLVPGAFGFGDEWKPVLAALGAQPALSSFVFDWPGPWSNPERSGRALASVLQQSIDASSPSLERVVVLAHSAGGMIADWAVRNVVVPPGRRLELIGLDGALRWKHWKTEHQVNTPIGFAVGGEPIPYPGIPERVAITHYICRDPLDRQSVDGDGTKRVFVGAKAGHNEMVGKVAVPIVATLGSIVTAP